MEAYQKLLTLITASAISAAMLLSFPANAAEASADLGDVNADGKVNASDATGVLCEAARRGNGTASDWNAEQEKLADANADGSINALDATEILTYAAQIGNGTFQGNFRTYMSKRTNVLEKTAPTEPTHFYCEDPSYTPHYDTCKAYWLDMSKQGDYFFDGEFLVIQFQVNEDTPNGKYPVTLSKTDIASWEEVRYYPEIINGEIAVGMEPDAQADPSDKDFSLKVNSASAKPGDTVTVTIDLANNPGFCGFVMDIQYDSNALTMIEAKGGKDYDAAVNLT